MAPASTFLPMASTAAAILHTDQTGRNGCVTLLPCTRRDLVTAAGGREFYDQGRTPTNHSVGASQDRSFTSGFCVGCEIAETRRTSLCCAWTSPACQPSLPGLRSPCMHGMWDTI